MLDYLVLELILNYGILTLKESKIEDFNLQDNKVIKNYVIMTKELMEKAILKAIDICNKDRNYIIKFISKVSSPLKYE